MQTVKQKRTLVRFAVQDSTYVKGKGATTIWKPISVSVGTDGRGKPIMTDCFYVEWLNSYGNVAVQQQAEGVIRPARIRMTFVKAVYDALVSKDVRIYLNGIIDDEHTFQLSSSPDNYTESNKLLEFHVKKYEGK